jgi:hypothetical protein
MSFKYKGRIPEDDPLHQVVATPPDGFPRSLVQVAGVGYIPQFAPTVVGNQIGFNPAEDCDGYFTSVKFQAHNNCYNYGVNIATNSVAQPGRRRGLLLTGDTDPAACLKGAVLDGLILAGGPGTTVADLQKQASGAGPGHFVALLVAPPDVNAFFRGDYHFVRCDDIEKSYWSQKDGPDQVTNFDFAGRSITDPLSANWTVNSVPLKPGNPDFLVTYCFHAFLFVPQGKVDII